MSEIIESVKEMLAELEQDRQQKREKALIQYRELLASGGDRGALLKCMDVLGKTVDDLKADAAVIAQSQRLEQAAVVPDGLDEQIKATNEASSIYSQATERLILDRKDEQSRLDGQLQHLRGKADSARDAAGKLVELKRRHFALFGVAPAPDVYSKPEDCYTRVTPATKAAPPPADRQTSNMPAQIVTARPFLGMEIPESGNPAVGALLRRAAGIR
jgi:hypothetical protein